MKSDKIHIIITGESGPGRTFLLDRRTARRALFTGISIIALLFAGTISGCYHWQEKSALEKKLSEVERNSSRENQELRCQLAETQKQLGRIRLQKLRIIDNYESKLVQLRRETEKLYSGDIYKRAKMIKALMDEVGIRYNVEEDPSHSGGLYIAVNSGKESSMINETDRFICFLQKLPIGRPVNGSISSLYGRRQDPLNHKRAFHAGLDFRANQGDEIHATGSGIVKTSSYQRGFGNCVIVDHGNGYETLYAHLSKRLVSKGERINKDQVIGLVGSTGRSTGSHLHYEVHYRDKSVNPIKFLRIARLLAGKK